MDKALQEVLAHFGVSGVGLDQFSENKACVTVLCPSQFCFGIHQLQTNDKIEAVSSKSLVNIQVLISFMDG